MCDYTDLQLPDESAPDLRQRRLDVLEVGGGRHEVRHLGEHTHMTFAVGERREEGGTQKSKVAEVA